MTGAYVTNIEQWPVGTVIQGLLREVPVDGEEISEPLSMAVSFQVARLGPDGLGIIFALQTKEELVVLKKLVERARASSERAGGTTASKQERDRPRRRFNILE